MKSFRFFLSDVESRWYGGKSFFLKIYWEFVQTLVTSFEGTFWIFIIGWPFDNYIINYELFFAGTTDRVVDDKEEKISRMLKHFQEHVHNKFNRYAFGFFFCEVANVCFSVFSVYLTHKFLLNQYLLYGVDIYRWAQNT